jgi:hypothetical protein
MHQPIPIDHRKGKRGEPREERSGRPGNGHSSGITIDPTELPFVQRYERDREESTAL